MHGPIMNPFHIGQNSVVIALFQYHMDPIYTYGKDIQTNTALKLSMVVILICSAVSLILLHITLVIRLATMFTNIYHNILIASSPLIFLSRQGRHSTQLHWTPPLGLLGCID